MKDYIVGCIAAILLTVIVVAPVGCQMNRDNIRTKAIATSADPIATSCAFDSTDGSGNSKAICTLRAAAVK